MFFLNYIYLLHFKLTVFYNLFFLYILSSFKMFKRIENPWFSWFKIRAKELLLRLVPDKTDVIASTDYWHVWPDPCTALPTAGLSTWPIKTFSNIVPAKILKNKQYSFSSILIIYPCIVISNEINLFNY